MGNSSSKKEEIDKLNTQVARQDRRIRELHHLNEAMRLQLESAQTGGADIDDQLQAAKDKERYTNLVLSGGGSKGVAYCGALKMLEKKGIYYDSKGKCRFKKFAGTSAGSITAALLAIGYSPKEITNMLMEMQTEDLFDDKWGVLRDAYNLVDDLGIAPGKFFLDFLGDLIESKTGDKDYTFEDLYNDTGTSLVVVGTSITQMKNIYFYAGHEDAAYHNIPIRVAVRISMSVPFVFEPYDLNGEMFVDGGVMDNYPIHVFDGAYPGDIVAQLNVSDPNPKTLGLSIMTEKEAMAEISGYNEVPDDLVSYGMTFINMLTAGHEAKSMRPSTIFRTIDIITPDYPLSKFKLSKQDKKALIQNGIDGVINYYSPPEFDDDSSRLSDSSE